MVDKEKIELAVKQLIAAIGEDNNREGLKETPNRVARMYEEIFSGIEEDPKKHLKIFHEDNSENPLIIRDIPINSVCEHHLLPFYGVAHIAYIPKNGKIIGLSKIARIANCFAKRLQVQERLTNQIAEFLYENLDPVGVEVMIEAEHSCMTMRGVRALGSKTMTYSKKGQINVNLPSLVLGGK